MTARGRLETLGVPVDVRGGGRHGVFTVTAGAEAGRVLRIPVDRTSTLGRSTDCSLVFDDESLSRVHADVRCLAGDYIVRDVGSRNGTFINGARVESYVSLKDGDRVQLGPSTLLRFSLVSEEEEQALRRVYESAVLDGLTGLYNRRHLEERLATELAYARRHGTVVAVVLADVDHFKRVNDRWGHDAGDAVLRAVAEVLSKGVRAEDVAGRFGGEEFLVVARDLVAAQVLVLAERLRKLVEQAPIAYGDQPLGVTASFGAASSVEPSVGADRDALVRVADERLYAAKERGRNRVVGG